MSQIEPAKSVSSNETCKSWRIHFFYVVFILVAIIVCLCTLNFSNQADLANSLNFAVGLTSMVLAVLAIVYAFIANNAFAGTASKIESAAASIRDETAQLDDSLQKVERAVNAIPTSLAKIEGSVDKTNKYLESQPKSELQPQPPANDEKVKAFATLVIERFINSTSWNGIKSLYLCNLAAKEDPKFNINIRDWTAKDPTISFDYAYGFLVAAASAGFVTFADDAGNIKVLEVPPIVSEKLTAEVNSRMGSGVAADIWAKQVKTIREFIALQSINNRYRDQISEEVKPGTAPTPK